MGAVRPGVARRGSLFAVATLCLALAGVARAEEPKVEVHANVVLVSNKDNAVDPALASMKDKFSKKGLTFTSYKLISSEDVSVQQKKAAELKLPTGKRATLKLESLLKGTATIAVAIEKGISTVYQLGREGSVFVDAGHNADGEVFLVLSPAGS